MTITCVLLQQQEAYCPWLVDRQSNCSVAEMMTSTSSNILAGSHLLMVLRSRMRKGYETWQGYCSRQMLIRLALNSFTSLLSPQMHPYVLTLKIACIRLSISSLFRRQEAGIESPSSTSSTSSLSRISLISFATSNCTSTKTASSGSHSSLPMASRNSSSPLPLVQLGSLVMCLAQQVCLQQQINSPMQTSLLKVVQSMDLRSRKASFSPLKLLFPVRMSELLETRCIMPAKAPSFFQSSRQVSNSFSISISNDPSISASTLASELRQDVSTCSIMAAECARKKVGLVICALKEAQQAWRTSLGSAGLRMRWRQRWGGKRVRRCQRSGEGECRKSTRSDASS